MTRRRTEPSPPRHPDIDAEEFVASVLERMAGAGVRAVPWYRLRELSPPFSRGWLNARIAAGDLEAKRLMGLTLVSEASLTALLERASTWKPCDGGER